MAGAQDLRSLYCSPQARVARGHPALGEAQATSRRPGMPLHPRLPGAAPSTPSHSLAHSLRLTSLPSSSSQAAHPPPPPTSWVPGPAEPKRPKHEWRGRNTAQLCALPRHGPSKSPAFNYASGLILMQLPGAAGGCWGGCSFLGFFFKPREVGLRGAVGEGAMRRRGKWWGRVFTHSAPLALGFCAPGAARRDRWALSREGPSLHAGFA